ncbi:hypothetical protein FA95DRAFT_806049 [Auriscalpium vulgare]|uniref:Uncharacterized protein n=1 Tax=Auriscalpium vulgare TaxID=40419 RepID=A0ACB8R9Q2_9AGAM|nr:hypothetical protein FA95DRAFT_806049 [Auriscalpium vulgare]
MAARNDDSTVPDTEGTSFAVEELLAILAASRLSPSLVERAKVCPRARKAGFLGGVVDFFISPAHGFSAIESRMSTPPRRTRSPLRVRHRPRPVFVASAFWLSRSLRMEPPKPISFCFAKHLQCTLCDRERADYVAPYTEDIFLAIASLHRVGTCHECTPGRPICPLALVASVARLRRGKPGVCRLCYWVPSK